MANKVALRSRKIAVHGSTRLIPGVILISGEEIQSVESYTAVWTKQEVGQEYEVRDVGEKVVFPGLVDLSVSIREEKLLDQSWKAIQGGVCVLALDSPPRGAESFTDCVFTSKSSLTTLQAALPTSTHLVISPLQPAPSRQQEDLDDFDIYTGTSTETSPENSPISRIPAVLPKNSSKIQPFSLFPEIPRQILPVVKQRTSISAIFQRIEQEKHLIKPEIPRKCSFQPTISPLIPQNDSLEADFSSFRQHNQRYNLSKERENIDKICAIASKNSAVRVLIAPVSSSSVIPESSPGNVVYGTAVSYIAFSYPDQVKPEDPLWKCVPPVREPDVRTQLIHSLLHTSTIHSITSHHQSQVLPGKYLCSFHQASDGVMTLGYSLQAVWTVMKASAKLEDEERVLTSLAEYMATRPAQWLGLQRGRIEAGCKADLVVWDPWTATCSSPHPLNPYTGLALLGQVHEVYLRGVRVQSSAPFGRIPHN